jgi:hypothetical protein
MEGLSCHRSEVITGLIAKRTKRREDLRAQLQKFETGEYHLGTTEVGVGGGDISQKWAQQLREWIAEEGSILADLDDLLVGILLARTRSSI